MSDASVFSGTPRNTTYFIEVDVQPRYVPEQSSPDDDRYVFAYTVNISNRGAVAAQVVSRHWVIKNAQGAVEEVSGLGVVGRQPFLQPGQSFEYTSGCPLNTPSGSMRGSLFCVAEDGERFDVPILPFELFIPKSSDAADGT
jgi:ApaG protein